MMFFSPTLSKYVKVKWKKTVDSFIVKEETGTKYFEEN